MQEETLRQWRLMTAKPHGLFCWFDPERETVKLFSRDSEEIDWPLDRETEGLYLDKVGSVVKSIRSS